MEWTVVFAIGIVVAGVILIVDLCLGYLERRDRFHNTEPTDQDGGLEELREDIRAIRTYLANRDGIDPADVESAEPAGGTEPFSFKM